MKVSINSQLLVLLTVVITLMLWILNAFELVSLNNFYRDLFGITGFSFLAFYALKSGIAQIREQENVRSGNADKLLK